MSECEAVDLLEDVSRDEREEEFLDNLEEEVERYQDAETGNLQDHYNPVIGSSEGFNPQGAAYNKLEAAIENGESGEEIMGKVREVHGTYDRPILRIFPNPCHTVVDEAIEEAYEETYGDIDGETPTQSSP